MKYSKTEYGILMKRFNNDISSLNKHVNERVKFFINKNMATCFETIRKDVYVGIEGSDNIGVFCNNRRISQAELAEHIKRDLFNNPK